MKIVSVVLYSNLLFCWINACSWAWYKKWKYNSMPCQRKRKGKRGLHLTDILIKFYILAEKCVPNKINLLEMLINEHNNPNLVFTNNICSNWPAYPQVTCYRLGRYNEYKCSPSSSIREFQWCSLKSCISWRKEKAEIIWSKYLKTCWVHQMTTW